MTQRSVPGWRPRLFRKIYLACGVASLLLGAVGVLLPLLPTVPFVILAAYCFGRSDPRIESWLLRHPRFGPAIWQGRVRGAIARKGKIAATLTFVVSIAGALILAPLPWALIPVVAALTARCLGLVKTGDLGRHRASCGPWLRCGKETFRPRSPVVTLREVRA